MKKIILGVVALTTMGVANAQSEFKPYKGDVTTEFGLSGGLWDSNFELNENNGAAGLLRFRYFAKDNMAFRFGLNVSSAKETENVYGGVDDENKGTYKSSATALLVNLGVEKHFAGTERLSPYIGGDLLFNTGNQKTVWDNATSNGSSYDEDNNGSRKGPGTIGVGLRGVVGADYYFAKRVYLGAEAGLGFLYSKAGKTTIKENDDPTVTLKSAGSEFELSPSVITGVRIGFVF